MDDFRRPVESRQGPRDPLISVIMPHQAGRDLTGALACFESQSYRNTELILVSQQRCSVPSTGRVVQVSYSGAKTTGELRNLACEWAAGEFIVHMDDDDWSSPHRLAIQCAALALHPIVGFRTMWFYDSRDGRAWHYTGAPNYVCGASLAYRRDYWVKHPFPKKQVGEDNDFIRPAQALRSLGCYAVAHMMVQQRHGGNTCRWDTPPACQEWRRAALLELPAEFLRTIPQYDSTIASSQPA